MCAEVKLLADWKRLMLQKGFSHSFWCTRDLKFFFSQLVFSFEGKENASLLSQLAFSFSKQLSYLRPIFVNLSTEKHLHCQLIVAFEQRPKNESWKKTKIVGGKKESYFRRLFGSLYGKQEISKVLYSCFVWSMKSVERVFQTVIVQWKQSSSSQKKY